MGHINHLSLKTVPLMAGRCKVKTRDIEHKIPRVFQGYSRGTFLCTRRRGSDDSLSAGRGGMAMPKNTRSINIMGKTRVPPRRRHPCFVEDMDAEQRPSDGCLVRA